MTGCLNCNHPYERHLFGGMCFYCDCKRAVYETDAPYGLARQEAAKGPNGSKPARKKRGPARRLGAN